MPPLELEEATGRYLLFAEWEEIAVMHVQGLTVRQMGRDPSTISRKLRRNAPTRSGKLDYWAPVAQWKPRVYVQQRANGHVNGPYAIEVGWVWWVSLFDGGASASVVTV
jgi:hypothetical protein